jgi:uncharacterized protein
MRFLSSQLLESYEAAALPATVGKRYEPRGDVTLEDGVRLGRPSGADLLDLDGEPLAIVPDTASWAFLTGAESRWWMSLRGEPLAVARQSWPGPADGLDTLVAGMYRRGLVTIDGQAAVDPSILRDGHNSTEVHLVELLVTERCNLGCVYCLAGTNARMPRMTWDTARRAVDLAFAMDEAQVLAFELSGGEPFLEFPLMQKVVAYIRRRQAVDGRPVFLNVQSNGTLLDAERVAWIRDNDIQLGLSFDGSPSAHDRSRPLLGGGRSFDRVVEGMDLLQRAGVSFGALVVLNRWNIANPRELADFLVENGVVGFKLNPVAYLGTARDTWSDIGVTQEEVVEYVRGVARLVAEEGYPLVESNLRTMCEFLVSKRRTTRCLRGHCGAGDSFQAVSAAGDVYPCGRATQSPGLRLGSVEDDLRSLSQPARTSLVIAEIRTRRPEGLDGCATCAYRQLCQAGCSAQAWERYGTVRHRTPECHFFKSGYPWLMRWLSFDEPAARRFADLGYFGDGGVEVTTVGSRHQRQGAVA